MLVTVWSIKIMRRTKIFFWTQLISKLKCMEQTWLHPNRHLSNRKLSKQLIDRLLTLMKLAVCKVWPCLSTMTIGILSACVRRKNASKLPKSPRFNSCLPQMTPMYVVCLMISTLRTIPLNRTCTFAQLDRWNFSPNLPDPIVSYRINSLRKLCSSTPFLGSCPWSF